MNLERERKVAGELVHSRDEARAETQSRQPVAKKLVVR